MILQSTQHENAVVVAVIGRLDAVTSAEFGKQMRAIIDGGSTRFVLDFQEFSFAYVRNQSYRLKLRTTSPTQYTFRAIPPVI